jgi:type I restriction enzyme S subunit
VFADTSEDIEGSGNFAFNDYKDSIFAGYHTVVARPKDLSFPKYYAYLFQSLNWKSQIQSLVNGVKVYSIGKGHLKNSYLLLPPLAEQEKIVSYLDSKTSKIDAYVADKEKEIELLQELKQKTIAEVVTKGLNPNVKMKGSGISWVGMIPEHWEMKQLRSFLTLFTVKGHGDAQLLSVTREQGVIERDKDDKEENHNFVPDDLSGYKYIEKGDFAINKMKAWQGSYAVSDYCGIVSPAYYTCKLKGVNKDFFSKAIRSKAYIPFFTQYSKGIRVGQWDLNPNALKSIPFFLPPIEEQRAIVTYIEEKCQKVDTLITELQAEIDYLREYKQRLIADVVTGQVNVQNL